MKEYHVDFSSWIVRAESARHATQIALKYIKVQHVCPLICNIEETDEEIEQGSSEGLQHVETESFRIKEPVTEMKNAFGGDTGIDADYLKERKER